MIVHDCTQGSPEWFAARLGIPTASEFDKILTSTGKISTQAETYMNRLIAERFMGKPAQEFEGNAWTERGNELEPQAVQFYELQNDMDTQAVGFCTDDARTMGASPDRLINGDGLLEVKCPAPHTHVQYMLTRSLDKKYWPQVQGQLLVTGREWVDLISYHPEMPPVIIRIERDDKYLAALAQAIQLFHEKLEEKLNKLEKAA